VTAGAYILDLDFEDSAHIGMPKFNAYAVFILSDFIAQSVFIEPTFESGLIALDQDIASGIPINGFLKDAALLAFALKGGAKSMSNRPANTAFSHNILP